MEKNITVIIPHKDIPNILLKCIDSIPFRTDVEIIVIDDNSNDKNKVILKALNRTNLKVIYTTESKGAGYARNRGIDEAQGKWLLFADADDYFHSLAFDFFDEYLDSKLDLIHFNQEGRFLNTEKYSNRAEQFSKLINKYILDPSPKNLEIIKYCMHTPYVKMIKKSLVEANNIRFDECIGSNDVMFSTLVGHFTNKISVDKRVAYFVNVRAGSLTKTRSIENAYSRFWVWVRYNKFMVENEKPNFQVLLLSRVFQSLIYFGFSDFKRYILFAKKMKVNLYVKGYLLFFSAYNYIISVLKIDKFLIKE